MSQQTKDDNLDSNLTLRDISDDIILYKILPYISPFELLNKMTSYGRGGAVLYSSDEVWKPYFCSYFPDRKKGKNENFKQAFIRESRETLKKISAHINSNVQAALSVRLRKDKAFMLAVVQKNAWFLEYVPDELKNDRDFILDAFFLNFNALIYVNPELKKDREFVLAAVKIDYQALKWASDEFKKDKEVVLAAVNTLGFALEWVSDELKKDKEVVLAAVKSTGSAFKWASDELKNDREFILAAVKTNCTALGSISNEFKNDKEIVFTAYKNCGDMLEDGSFTRKNDKSFILGAIRRHACLLEYASDRLKNDKEVILAALVQDGRAIKYASWNQIIDPLVPLTALLGNHTSFCLNALSAVALTLEGALLVTGVILTITAIATANPALVGVGAGIGLASVVAGCASLGFFGHVRQYASSLSTNISDEVLAPPTI